MIKLLDIPENITYSLSNVKLILVTNNYFVEINEVIKGLIISWKYFYDFLNAQLIPYQINIDVDL